MRTTCHYILFPSERRYHFIFKNKPELPPAEPTAAIEKPKTLDDVLQEAQRMFQKAKEKIKLIENYYKGKNIPEDLQKALNDFRKIANELEQAIVRRSKRNGKWEGKGADVRQVRTEQEIIEEMMTGMDDIFGTVRKKNIEVTEDVIKRTKGDPMYGEIGGLNIEETTLRPSPKLNIKSEDKKAKTVLDKKEAPVKVDESKAPLEREPKREENPRGWESYQLRRVIDKILGVSKESINDKELLVLRFFVPKGKSRDFWYVDRKTAKKYVLERDLTGDFLRIRRTAFKTQLSGMGRAEDVENPSLALKAGAGGPKWKSEGQVVEVAQSTEKDLKNVNKNIDWLLSDKSSVGSRIILETSEKLKTPEGAPILSTTSLELIKSTDGALRTEVKTQTGGDGVETKESKPVRRFFSKDQYAAAREFIADYVRPELSLKRVSGGTSDLEREKELTRERQKKILNRTAHSFALNYMAEKLKPGENQNAMKQDLDRVLELLGKLELPSWSYTDNTVSFNTVSFRMQMDNNKLSILEKNPKYEQKKNQPQFIAVAHYEVPTTKPEAKPGRPLNRTA